MSAKSTIYDHILSLLHDNAAQTQRAIDATKESRNNDTKSSAGDKYETGREMMQIEIDKFEQQLGKLRLQQRELQRLQIHLTCDNVEFGALVATNHESYFISIGLGRVVMQELTCFAISLASPIGAALKDKKVGDKITFQGREIEILQIQ
jgi:transcription elongation GreA/GreB family factor